MTKLICIVCPRGCHLEVDENLNVKGNSCPRGEKYGKQEVVCPMRTLTSTVKINSVLVNSLPVKTSDAIPKNRMFECLKEINKIEVNPPVMVGDIIKENILNLGVNLLATREILK